MKLDGIEIDDRKKTDGIGSIGSDTAGEQYAEEAA